MRPRWPRRPFAFAALLALPLAPGCGDGSAAADPDRRTLATIATSAVPGRLFELDAAPEPLGDAVKGKRPLHIEAVSLWSLRQADLVASTLQISRFRDEDRFTSASFRNAVVSQIGGATPTAQPVGDTTVWLSEGSEQRLAVWFRDRHLFVLSTRADYRRPRALLRAALELRP